MRILVKFSATCLSLSIVLPLAVAQTPAPSDERGAVLLYIAGGWSFGLPANQAEVSIPGAGTSVSPERKTLAAPSAGIGITVWKFLVPYFDLTAYDAGKASASVGSVTSEVEGEIVSFNGGVRVVGGRSKARGYVEFGGGVLHQNLSGNFVVAGQTTPVSGGGSIGEIMYGGGVQLFIGHRWGTDIGFDGFHATQPFAQGGQNFSRVRLGFFFQTKSVVQ